MGPFPRPDRSGALVPGPGRTRRDRGDRHPSATGAGAPTAPPVRAAAVRVRHDAPQAAAGVLADELGVVGPRQVGLGDPQGREPVGPGPQTERRRVGVVVLGAQATGVDGVLHAPHQHLERRRVGEHLAVVLGRHHVGSGHEHDAVGLGVGDPELDVGDAQGRQALDGVVDALARLPHVVLERPEVAGDTSKISAVLSAKWR